MAGDLHVQISIEYNEQQRMVRYRRLLEPYQGRHDHTMDQLAEPPLTLHLYWCPNLPGESTRDALLPGLEQFVQRTIAEKTLLKPSDTPTTNVPSRYREIYNTLTKQSYIYRDGEWLPKTSRREPLPLTLTNGTLG